MKGEGHRGVLACAISVSESRITEVECQYCLYDFPKITNHIRFEQAALISVPSVLYSCDTSRPMLSGLRSSLYRVIKYEYSRRAQELRMLVGRRVIDYKLANGDRRKIYCELCTTGVLLSSSSSPPLLLLLVHLRVSSASITHVCSHFAFLLC